MMQQREPMPLYCASRRTNAMDGPTVPKVRAQLGTRWRAQYTKMRPYSKMKDLRAG